MKKMAKFKLLFVGMLLLSNVYCQKVSAQINNIEVWEDKYKVEEDGFCWIEMSGKDLDAEKRGEWRRMYLSGVKDKNGKVLIPLSRGYVNIYYSNEDNEGYPPFFIVSIGKYNGACTIDGREIVSPMFGSVHYDIESDVFVFKEYIANPYNPDNFFTNLFNDDWYSLGVSLNKKGEPYMSNKGIVSYSEYYTAPKPSNNYSNSTNNSYSSNSSTSTAPILNADNLATGIITVVAGYAIIAGIADLFRGSSSSSSSNNNTHAAINNTHAAITTKDNVDIISFGYSWGGYTSVKIRNKNSYDVYVTIEAGFKQTDGNLRWSGLKCISYGNSGSAALVRAGSVQEANFVGVNVKPDYISIISVK